MTVVEPTGPGMDAGAWIALGAVGVGAFYSHLSLKAARDQAGTATRTFDAAQKREQDRREGRQRALRTATMPIMSETGQWAEDVGALVMDVPNVGGDEVVSLAVVGYPESYVQIIMSVIEAGENEAVSMRLAKILSNIQVVTSRARGVGRRRRYSLNQSSRTDFLRDVAIIHAQAVSVLEWARRDKETVSPRITWDEIGAELRAMGILGRQADLVRRSVAKRDQEANAEDI